jgi:hypothetical protein
MNQNLPLDPSGFKYQEDGINMKLNRWFCRPAAIMVMIAAILTAQHQKAVAAQLSATQGASSGGATSITVPAGARIVFAMVRPVASKTVGAGETVYLQTTFPVIVGEKLAIPAGTFVQGVLAEIPVRSKHQIELPLKSVVMIFGDGITVAVPGAIRAIVDRDKDSSVLDVGGLGELVLPGPLLLEAKRVADALDHPRRLLAVHDLMAASRPAQNPATTCYTPEIPPRPAKTVSGGGAPIMGPNGEVVGFVASDSIIPGVRAKPGTPYPCP